MSATLLKRTLRLGNTGTDVEAMKRGVARFLDRLDRGRALEAGKPAPTDTRLKRLNNQPKATRRRYGPFFALQVRRAKRELALRYQGNEANVAGTTLWVELDNQDAFDELARDLFRSYEGKPKLPPVPDLGPIHAGGQTVLEHDLTHATSGIPDYPAFDDAFTEGREIVAPEPMRVTRPSSSRPGLAFYATGDSKIRYWFGHLDRTHAAGRKFAKGDLVGRVAPNNIGGGPHVHVGVDARALTGGKVLAHHTNYTHGAATVGEQLRRALGS
mgnify:CR=1 FL=1